MFPYFLLLILYFIIIKNILNTLNIIDKLIIFIWLITVFKILFNLNHIIDMSL
jgi:hypothetical protein